MKPCPVTIRIFASHRELMPGNLVKSTGGVVLEQSEDSSQQPFRLEKDSILMYLGFSPGRGEDEYILKFIIGDKVINIVYHYFRNINKSGGWWHGGKYYTCVEQGIDIGAAFIKLDI